MLDTIRELRRQRFLVKRFDDLISHKQQIMIAPYTVTKDMTKEHLDYFKSFGFNHVNSKYMEWIVSVNNTFDKRYIPDDFFNVYIDNPYPNPEITPHWKNKCYQEYILPFVKYPETLVRNVNGYYIDNEDNFLSIDYVLDMLKDEKRVVIKPSMFNGGGLNVNFYNGNEVTKNILDFYKKDFVIQRKMKQSPFMESLNPACVNTDKIHSFLFEGEVYILSSFMRFSTDGSEIDNITTNNSWCLVNVNKEGQLSSKGYGNSESISEKTPTGILYKDIKLDFHHKCVDIVKRAHRRLLFFPFVGWDFAQDVNGEPVLIEYNMKWHTISCSEYGGGPLFGDMTEDVLKKAAKDNKYKLFC